MKKKILISAAIIFGANLAFSQGTAINTTGASADSSAMLDVSSTSPFRGFLLPRMSTSERNTISNPATGLQIFNTTTNCLNIWIGASWKQICGECDFPNPTAGSNSPVCTGDTLKLTAATISGASYQWSGPDGFTSTFQNPSIPDVQANAGGSYFVSATLNGCTSQQQNTVVTINNSPEQPSAISGPSSPCEGSAGNVYSVTNVSGITYNWTVPSGWSITAGQNTNSITVTAGTSSGSITVSPANSCGSGNQSILSVSTSGYATGGTITNITGYRIHTFTTSGTFTPGSCGPSTVEALVVAGGGGGSFTSGGGGGGGGVVYHSSYSIGGATGVTIGNGGAGAQTDGADGSDGGNSVFGSITALGGGGGAHTSNGHSGGCGGGAGYWNGSVGGSSTQGSSGGGTGYGYAGGNDNRAGSGPPYPSAGGGGAGGAGYPVAAGTTNGGDGGIGFQSSITGTPAYYAGGGGGCSGSLSGTSGGLGGGGNGGIQSYDNSGSLTDGTPNSGGGGGGGTKNGVSGGGNGGSGIVIVRYAIP